MTPMTNRQTSASRAAINDQIVKLFVPGIAATALLVYAFVEYQDHRDEHKDRPAGVQRRPSETNTAEPSNQQARAAASIDAKKTESVGLPNLGSPTTTTASAGQSIGLTDKTLVLPSKPPALPSSHINAKPQKVESLPVQPKSAVPNTVSNVTKEKKASQKESGHITLAALLPTGAHPKNVSRINRHAKPKPTEREIEKQRELVERVEESKLAADSAYGRQDYTTAVSQYEQLQRDAPLAFHESSASMIPNLASIIDCFHKLSRFDRMKPYLASALNIFIQDPKLVIKEVDKTDFPSFTWLKLADASLTASNLEVDSARKADYLDWARNCFELAFQKWNRAKDPDYRRMIGKYCTVLRMLGELPRANQLDRTERPIYSQPQKPPQDHPPGKKPHPHQSRYIRNY
jgi:hypothetical protein